MDDPAERAELGAALLGWYARERRVLPWRASRDPYCIWVSEIMLQQTQVATVIGYYERWMQRFPSVEHLARAETAEVLLAWEGLGYYSRARNLQRAAQLVLEAHGGVLPRSLTELRALPGIGAYSAGAIASIAYDLDEPAVDGNIVRVLCRVFALGGDPSRAPLRDHIWRLARQLIPAGRARDFNQALMELGATCCTPRSPRCERCPVRAHCVAHAKDEVEQYPSPKARPKVTQVRRAAAVIERAGKVLVVRAGPDAPRWAGMWQFPDTELGLAQPAEDDLEKSRLEKNMLERSVAETTGVVVNALDRIGNLQHQVTRFRIAVDVYACRPRSGRAKPLGYAEVRWTGIEGLATLAMPAAHRKIARSLT